MHIGFRPRLKARPSLYDLIRSQSVEHLSIKRPELVEVEYLPELPASPVELRPTPPTPERAQLSAPVLQEPINMGPKKVVQDEDGEEQYGTPRGQLSCTNFPLTIAAQARFTPFLGRALLPITTDTPC